MASIQCPGCKAHISVPGLIDCPRCQTFLDPPWLREHHAAQKRSVMRPGSIYTYRDWFNLTLLGALVCLIVFIGYLAVSPSKGKTKSQKISAALFQCQQRILGLAEYGDAEMPPYVKNYGKGDEFYFAWPSGTFHFKNGFGSPVRMSASCIGDVSTGEIKQLTLNGKEIL